MSHKNVIPESFRELARVIGKEEALKLCRAYGGGVLYIPKLKMTDKRARELAIDYLRSIMPEEGNKIE